MRKPTWATLIRQLLRLEDDGLTVAEISQLLDASKASIYEALNNPKLMPDAYIDRWTETNKYVTSQAVWCVVVPPLHCPRPEPKQHD